MTQTAATTAPEVITRLRDLKVGVRDLIMLRPQDISIEDGHNPRDYTLPENRAHLDSLKASIRENGTLVPLLVRFDTATKTAVLVDGECRLRANLELIAEGVPIESVPVSQVKGTNEAERLVIALTANTGKPLSKWESGNGFQRLIGYGWDVAKIASRLGFTERFVQEALELADAPQEVKQLLSTAAVTPALALQAMRQNGAQAVETLKAAAAQAAGEGKKTATRALTSAVPNPKVMLSVIARVVESVQDDLFDDEYKFIEVDKAAMRRLAAFVGITAETQKKGGKK